MGRNGNCVPGTQYCHGYLSSHRTDRPPHVGRLRKRQINFQPVSKALSVYHLLPPHAVYFPASLRSISLPPSTKSVSYTHLRAHETGRNLVCRLLLEKKKK